MKTKVAKFFGWEIHFPHTYAFYLTPTGMRITNESGQEIARATIKLNRSALVDISSPLELEISLSQQRIILHQSVSNPG